MKNRARPLAQPSRGVRGGRGAAREKAGRAREAPAEVLRVLQLLNKNAPVDTNASRRAYQAQWRRQHASYMSRKSAEHRERRRQAAASRPRG